MILSNSELHRALDEKRLIIDPEPVPRVPTLGKHCPYDTHSVDLTLGGELSIPQRDLPFTYDLSQPQNLSKFLSLYSEKKLISEKTPFKLEHGQFVLGRTRERVYLPIPDEGECCLAARIEGKSSRARMGLLVHLTAPTVHAGFEGTLALEMINLGPARSFADPCWVHALRHEGRGRTSRDVSHALPVGQGVPPKATIRQLSADPRAPRARDVILRPGTIRSPHSERCDG